MSGTWNLGKLVGKGNLKQGSQLYEGTFENVLDCENIVDLIISKATLYLQSVRTGKGIRYYDPNSVYAGDFINGIRDGNGTMVWENNDVRIINMFIILKNIILNFINMTNKYFIYSLSRYIQEIGKMD